MKKNAIVCLTRGYIDINQYDKLINRNKFIYENIIKNSGQIFDMIIYHEGNISETQQKHIQSKTEKLKLTFLNLKKTGNKKAFNNDINKINLEFCAPTQLSNSFPLGYKHMCHFWSIDFLVYLKDYKYIIRIDEDCLVNTYDNDVLKNMLDNELFFTSPYFEGQDDDRVIVGMENLWSNFIKENNITPKKDFKNIMCPYTNFMIFDIENIINNEIIMSVLKKIDLSNCIYSNRWGDLPIWGMIISTLIDEKHYHENKKIKYYHGSHNKLIN